VDQGVERRVAGVLLAAGTSSRMGGDKMLLQLDGESVLRRAARRAVAGGLSPVIVVLGAHAEHSRELDGLSCRVACCTDDAMSASIRTGLGAVPSTAPAAMILLADMPLVTAEMIRAMIARYESTRAPLVISDYDGVNAPPVLYDRSLFAEGGGRQVVERHRLEAEVLYWPGTALADLDVPEDYARLTAR
jgi:molybdenum cofactor cytidylyltransferase